MPPSDTPSPPHTHTHTRVHSQPYPQHYQLLHQPHASPGQRVCHRHQHCASIQSVLACAGWWQRHVPLLPCGHKSALNVHLWAVGSGRVAAKALAPLPSSWSAVQELLLRPNRQHWSFLLPGVSFLLPTLHGILSIGRPHSLIGWGMALFVHSVSVPCHQPTC